MKQSKRNLSRREFARNLALVTATAAAMPAGSALGEERTTSPAAGSTQQAAGSSLTPEGEAQYQIILSKYGSRLSEEQKADVKRLVGAAVQTGKTMETFKLENWNEPAPIFKVLALEKGADGER